MLRRSRLPEPWREMIAALRSSIYGRHRELTSRRRDMSDNSTNGVSKRIVPSKFAHAVLRTNKFKQMVDWYKTVLLADIVFENQMLAFMTYDDEHHRLAIAAFPGIEDRAPRSAGLDHLAYTYANLGDLVATYERLKAAGITPVVPINHGLTTSMYYRDPDGNKVELQIDNFDSVEELKGFFRGNDFSKNPIGVSFDPDELARQYHAGVPEAELKKYRPEAGLDPNVMRNLAH
jgi:catechol 2,3-dioxygenase-like lactoylglutathione lyase family enzyme